MTPFDTAWSLLKYKIPSVYGSSRDGSVAPSSASRPDHPGWGTMGFVDNPSEEAPGYFVRPNPRKGLESYSAINLRPIVSRIAGVAPDEDLDRQLTDDEIEDIISEIGVIGLHEGTHIALDPIIQQILDEGQPLPPNAEEREMGDPRFSYPYYQEFGAHTASSDYQNRLEAPRQPSKAARESSKFQRNRHMIQEFPRGRRQDGHDDPDVHPDYHEDGRRYRLREMQDRQRRRLR